MAEQVAPLLLIISLAIIGVFFLHYRHRRRQQVRLGVILGTLVGATALTLWQISGLTSALPANFCVTGTSIRNAWTRCLRVWAITRTGLRS